MPVVEGALRSINTQPDTRHTRRRRRSPHSEMSKGRRPWVALVGFVHDVTDGTDEARLDLHAGDVRHEFRHCPLAVRIAQGYGAGW